MRRCLITGASSGIGAAIAARFRTAGYLVVGLQRHGPGVQVDLGNLSAILPAWQQALEQLGGAPDVVVLNAGRSLYGSYHMVSDQDLVDLVNLLLVSPLLIAREAIRALLLKEGKGHLLFIGSQAALPGARDPGNSLYAACKGGLHAIVGPLAREYGPCIRVNAIAPGDVDTPLAERSLNRMATAMGRSLDTVREEVASLAPLRRFVRPEEIAEAALFLDQCEAMNGAVLNCSAGRSAH
jgi:3-oxoacyl-[acyl-carrier protein] reductase